MDSNEQVAVVSGIKCAKCKDFHFQARNCGEVLYTEAQFTAALVEKEREVWDKAIGIVSENFHVFGQDILPALEAARTSEKDLE